MPPLIILLPPLLLTPPHFLHQLLRLYQRTFPPPNQHRILRQRPPGPLLLIPLLVQRIHQRSSLLRLQHKVLLRTLVMTVPMDVMWTAASATKGPETRGLVAARSTSGAQMAAMLPMIATCVLRSPVLPPTIPHDPQPLSPLPTLHRRPHYRPLRTLRPHLRRTPLLSRLPPPLGSLLPTPPLLLPHSRATMEVTVVTRALEASATRDKGLSGPVAAKTRIGVQLGVQLPTLGTLVLLQLRLLRRLPLPFLLLHPR